MGFAGQWFIWVLEEKEPPVDGLLTLFLSLVGFLGFVSFLKRKSDQLMMILLGFGFYF